LPTKARSATRRRPAPPRRVAPSPDRRADAPRRSIADQCMAGLVIPEIIIAEAAGRDEAVSAGVVELDEQPRPGDAADAAFEGRADLLAQEMRDEPVDRLALRLHGAPLRAGNIGRDLAERAHVVAVRQAVVAALHRAD